MKLYKLEAGIFHCDGGAVFGVVPKKVWQKRYPANDENFCALAARCLLIDTGSRLVLIDNGTGAKQLDYLKYYDVKGVIDFEEELKKKGYTCADVTDVVLTHLHFDHCGGSTYYSNKENKTVALTFPNANYWVGKEQWENFLNPNAREADSFFPENMMPVYEAGKLCLVDENQWLCEGVELRLFNGHTVGQLACYIYDKDRTLVYVGDIIPVAAAIPIAWISAYDTYPVVSMQEKQQLLDEAVEKKQILFFEHDNYVECCTVKKVNDKYRVLETGNLATQFSFTD